MKGSWAFIFAAGAAVGLLTGLLLAPMLTSRAGLEVSASTSFTDDKVSAGSMICTTGSADPVALRSLWCEAQLAESERRARMVAVEWPDDPEVMSPGAWVEAMEQAASECDLPFELDTVECTEFPCLATVRSKPGRALSTDSKAWISDCSAFERLFPETDVGVASSPVVCGDGALEDVFVLYAVSDDQLTSVIADRAQDDSEEFMESMRHLTRRLDAVVTTHGCADEP